MKTEIDERGTLTIKAETPLESYALARWHEGWDMPSGEQKSTLCIYVPMRDMPEAMTEPILAVKAPNVQHEGCELASVPLDAPVGREEG